MLNNNISLILIHIKCNQTSAGINITSLQYILKFIAVGHCENNRSIKTIKCQNCVKINPNLILQDQYRFLLGFTLNFTSVNFNWNKLSLH